MRRVSLALALSAVAGMGLGGIAPAAPAQLAQPDIAHVAKKGGKGNKGGKGKREKPKGKRRKRRRGSAALRLFSSCSDVVGYGDANARRVIGDGYQPAVMPPFPTANSPTATSAPVSAPTPQKKSKAEETPSFSQTNVQVQNVDEPDIVKTDGKTIFAIGGNSLQVIDALTPQPQLLSSRKLEGFSHELLLSGSKLLVISQKREIPESVEPPPVPDPAPPPSGGSDSEPPHALARTVTILSEFDVTNPAATSLLRTEEIDGRYVSARLIGDQVRIVITAPPAATIAPPSSLRSPVGGWTPYSEFTDEVSGATDTGPALDSCPEVGYPGKFSGLDMLSVLTVDLAKGLPVVDSEGVMSSGDIVYASADSLYVATERWLGDQVANDPSRAETAIHRFDISQPGSTTYISTGFVRGRLLNQFSMDEYDGHLRVASTGNPFGEADEGGNESFVSVLKADTPTMKLVGRVGNLGLGERIYAVRMIEENAFVVTFRRVDPLYTLDLSSPGNPRVLGELKILGYSAYLHPIADDTLLGVGASATEEGNRLGAQVSLFDVSNLNKPKRLAQATVSGGRTSVEDTHHAFLYWPPTAQVVIPVNARLRKGRVFLGAVAYRIGKGRIRRVGTITHNAIPLDEIQRSLVVQGRLFTLSCAGLEVAEMTGFAELGRLAFADPAICQPPPVETVGGD